MDEAFHPCIARGLNHSKGARNIASLKSRPVSGINHACHMDHRIAAPRQFDQRIRRFERALHPGDAVYRALRRSRQRTHLPPFRHGTAHQNLADKARCPGNCERGCAHNMTI